MEKQIKTPAPSATVILLREEQDEFQVYLLKRSVKSRFMAGNYVFPGGKVDALDCNSEFWKNRIDMASTDLSDRFSSRPDSMDILSYGIAAIRETFEESGVMLSKTIHSDTPDPVYRTRDSRIRQASASFKDLVEKNDLTLSFSSLYPWRHWITPTLMNLRFTTLFFLAVMPQGQSCRPDNYETTNGLWINPKKGLEKNITGDLSLSPTTLVTLHQLMGFERLKEITDTFDTLSFGSTIMPRLLPLNGEKIIIEPWDDHFHSDTIDIDKKVLKDSILAVGEPFSRLWMQDGIWKPIG